MLKIERLPELLPQRGCRRSKHYDEISKGLWPPGIKLGPRAVGWLQHENQAVLRARVAGKSDDQIRALVAQLVAARKEAA